MTADLSEIAIGHVLSFLPLEDLVKSTRRVSKTFQKVSDEDARWIPVIAPPNLAHVKLDINKHGQVLRRLYYQYLKFHLEMKNNTYLQLTGSQNIRFAKRSVVKLSPKLHPRATKDERRRYNDMRDDARKLVDHNNKNRDAFFSLAPWFRQNEHLNDETFQRSTYPTPWLHRMVYDQPCPTTITENSHSSLHALDLDEPSFFFQRKSWTGGPLLRGEHRFPRKLTALCPSSPIDPSIEHPNMPPIIKRVVIQPVNFRKQGSGERFPRVDDLDMELIEGLNDVSKKVLECYFGNGNVIVNPLREHQVTMGDEGVDQDGLVDSRVLYSFPRHDLLAESNSFICDETAVLFVVAPEVYRASGYWGKVKSVPLWRDCTSIVVRDIEENEFVWSVSHSSSSRFSLFDMKCGATTRVLYCVFYNFLPSQRCGNNHCAFSGCSGYQFILCPICLRRLELAGVIQDVPRSLEKLACLLQQEPFSSTCEEDVTILTRYGYIIPDDSSKKRKRN